MTAAKTTSLSVRSRSNLTLKLVALAVAANGLLIIYGSLIIGIIEHNEARLTTPTLDLRLIAAFGLLYLSQLIARQKQAAWIITVPLYCFLLGLIPSQFLMSGMHHHLHLTLFLRDIALPLLIVGLLIKQ